MGALLKDYSGLIFNELTAVNFEFRKNNKTYWLFNCNCGSSVIRNIDYVKIGKSKSCGCISLKKRSISDRSSISFTNLYHRYKTSSKTRGILFELTKKDFRIITESNCHYCGIQPFQKGRKTIEDEIYFYNGIDRINNNVGYILSNSKACCFVCNRAKRDMEYLEFLEYINRLKNFNMEL